MRPGTLLRWHALKEVFKSELRDNSLVLDIGSFDGFTSNNLTKIFPNIDIILIDLDKSGLQKAIEKSLHALHASALQLPIGDKKVDIVLCLDLIEHVDDDGKVIAEISRVLKRHGKVILTTPKENGVNFPLLDRKKTEEINKGWGHVRPGYSINEIETLFNSNNLAVEKKSGYFNFLTRLVYPYTMSSKNTKSTLPLYRAIINLEPIIKYGADEHIIVGKKL